MRDREPPYVVVTFAVLVTVAFASCEPRTEFTGGTRLVFRFDQSWTVEPPAELSGALVKVIEKRLEYGGIKKFRVQSGDEARVSVEVPDTVKDLDQIKSLVSTEGRLAFHLVVEGKTSEAELDRQEAEERVYQDAQKAWRERVREWSSRPEDDQGATVPRPREPLPPERVVRRNADGRRFLLENAAGGVVMGAIILDAIIERDRAGRPVVGLRLTSEGGARFGELTGNSIGRGIAVVLDGLVLMVAIIHDRIERRAQISGGFTLAEAKSIVSILRGGPLPVPLEFVEEEAIETRAGE